MYPASTVGTSSTFISEVLQETECNDPHANLLPTYIYCNLWAVNMNFLLTLYFLGINICHKCDKTSQSILVYYINIVVITTTLRKRLEWSDKVKHI